MLAIVIPYYKYAFFEATLRSLANQTDKRFKVYIGDDASPENPSDLLEKYRGQFDFVHHRFDENLGGLSLVKQWERCIALTGKEEWLMILGDDDVLGENVVEEFYENLPEVEREGINVVRFATQKINGEGNSISDIYMHPKIEKSVDFFFSGVRSSLSEYVFKKEKVLEIGFKKFPLGWLSDVLAVLEVSNFNSLYTVNEALVYVRMSNLNISGRQDNLKPKGKAYFCFHLYLLEKKHVYFTEIQIKELLSRTSRSFLNNKKEVTIFLRISKIYLCNLFVSEYFRFIKSIAVIIFQKK